MEIMWTDAAEEAAAEAEEDAEEDAMIVRVCVCACVLEKSAWDMLTCFLHSRSVSGGLRDPFFHESGDARTKKSPRGRILGGNKGDKGDKGGKGNKGDKGDKEPRRGSFEKVGLKEAAKACDPFTAEIGTGVVQAWILQNGEM